MKISIKRTYHPDGTNGVLTVDISPKLNCYTIELPNKGNKNRISCIPEGKYKAIKHHSDHLGDVLWLQNVPGRDMIYLHPANDALKELLGCIAPVTTLLGPGKGSASKARFEPIRDLAYKELAAGRTVEVEITS